MPPSEQRLERLVGGVLGVERQVVAEHDEAVMRAANNPHQVRQALDILAMDLDELERGAFGMAREFGVDAGVRRLHQRRLAHAARAPQQGIVGRQPLGEALGILHQHVAHAVDALEQRHLDAVDVRHRRQAASVGMPYEGVRAGKIGHDGALRRQPFERVGNAREDVAVSRRSERPASAWIWDRVATWTSISPWGAASEKCAALSGPAVPPQAG